MPNKPDLTEQSTALPVAKQPPQNRQTLQRIDNLLDQKPQARTANSKQTNEQLDVEISERIRTEKQLQNRIAFDHILTSISTQFINLATEEIDANINKALEKVGQFTGYDRCYIYLIEENGRAIKNTHEWYRSPHLPTLEDFRTLPTDLFQNWLPRLLRQETIHIQDIQNSPHKRGNELKLLRLQEVCSILIIPLMYGKETIGLFGLDSQKSVQVGQQEKATLLKVVGAIFVSALMRKKTEELLAEERNFAQQIMATMGQGVMTMTVEGIIEYTNPACARMMGHEAQALAGKTALAFTIPEDHPKLIHAQIQNMEGQASSYEACFMKSDGSPLFVLVNSVPNFNHQGRIIGSIATITDLTERRAAEAQIKANAEELKEIYQAAIQLFKPSDVYELAEQIATITVEEMGFEACGVLLLREPVKIGDDLFDDLNDNYLIWLARHGRCYGASSDIMALNEAGLIGTAVYQGEIIYTPDVTQEPRFLPSNTYTRSQLIIPLRAYDMIIGAIDLQSSQLNGFDERSQRIITVFADHAGLALETVRLYDQLQEYAQTLEIQINERKKIEEALRASEQRYKVTNAKLAQALRTKDEFLANMSHELRTPLNAILGKSEILLEGIHGTLNKKQAASIQVIEKSGSHLLELINDILDMAKIEADKVTLKIQPVSVNLLCESSLQFVRQMAHNKKIKLRASIDPMLHTCLADERRLKQILINLLSNAVKFTPAGGEVGLNIANNSAKGAVQFQVWDTGVGISRQDMDQLYKPFVQLDSSLSRQHEGTGLGLSLVYRLTEMHGGSVSLESEVGIGSCFTISLPQNPVLDFKMLQQQAKKDRKELGHYKNHYLPGEEPLILLVEDNETNVETITEYLPCWGYRLSVASTGMEAIMKAHQEKPALILMDIQIPEMDGLTAVRQLRQEEAFQQVPIIALTALAMRGDKEKCLEAGANEYLSKPIQLRQLVTLINKLLSSPGASET